jgi:hypothetical protein
VQGFGFESCIPQPVDGLHGAMQRVVLDPLLTLTLALAVNVCPWSQGGERIVINCSGRGDKDVNTVIKLLGMQ